MTSPMNPNSAATFSGRIYSTTANRRAGKLDHLADLKVALQGFIDWHRGVKNIRVLDLTRLASCPIKDIPAGFLTDLGFTELDEVILSQSDIREIPPGVRELKVRKLTVDHSKNLCDLSGLAAMEVEVLEAESCGFAEWPDLSGTHLKEVNLIGNQVWSIPNGQYPQTLETVYISGVPTSLVIGQGYAAVEVTEQAGLSHEGSGQFVGEFVEEPYYVDEGTVIQYTRASQSIDGDSSGYSSADASSPDHEAQVTTDADWEALLAEEGLTPIVYTPPGTPQPGFAAAAAIPSGTPEQFMHAMARLDAESQPGIDELRKWMD